MVKSDQNRKGDNIMAIACKCDRCDTFFAPNDRGRVFRVQTSMENITNNSGYHTSNEEVY